MPTLKKRKIIAVLNTKGGEGKTTLVIMLATALSRKGFRVLVVDTDPQQSLSGWFKSGEAEPIFNVFASHKPEELKNLDRIPEHFDYVLVDGAATVNDSTAAIVHHADFVLIPIKSSPLSFAATSAVLHCIHEERRRRNLPARFVLTMYQPRAALNYVLKNSIRENGFDYFRTPLSYRQIYMQALANGGTPYDWTNQPARNAAGEADNITRELLEAMSNEK